MLRNRIARASSRIAVRSSRRLPVETLENRRLLAVAASNGVLSITGSAGNDAYLVGLSGSNITVRENGGAAQSFPLSSVTRINASLNGGNDTIDINNAVKIPATVSGGSGADGIITGGGNDLLDGGTGNDYLDGRDGNDTVTYASRTEAVTGSLHVDFEWQPGTSTQKFSLRGSGGVSGESDSYAAAEALLGGSGNDTLSTSADTLESTNAENFPPAVPQLRIAGFSGNDQLTARGVPTSGFYYPTGIPAILAEGGDGDDKLRFIYTSTNATLNGGNGNDEFEQLGDDYRAQIVAGTGYDKFRFDGLVLRNYTVPLGLEEVSFGSADTIIGNDEANVLIGQARFVDGRGGNDRIEVDGFDASISGGTGNDTIVGGRGNDTIDGGTGNDSIIGGAGLDTVTYQLRTEPITASIDVTLIGINTGEYWREQRVLGGGGAAGESDTYRDVETIVGGTGADRLSASGQVVREWFPPNDNTYPVRLNGGLGNDTLSVSSSPGNAEYLQLIRITADGGEGDDFLDFSGNQDPAVPALLVGGVGNDTFGGGAQNGRPAEIDAGPGIDWYHHHSIYQLDVTLPDGLENFYSSTDRQLTVVGNDLNNVIQIPNAVGSSVEGRGGNDSITTGGGNDTIDGGSGNDTIDGGTGNDSIDAGLGEDTITYASRVEPVVGSITMRRETLYENGPILSRANGYGSAGEMGETDSFINAETLTGGSGKDSLKVSSEDRFYTGPNSTFPVRINGGPGNDQLRVSSGVTESSSNHALIADGGDGRDDIDYSGNRDYMLPATLIGGEGNDNFFDYSGGGGYSALDAGPGIDLLRVETSFRRTYTMPAGLENFFASGGLIDVTGNNLNNVIEVAASNGSTVRGMGGNDTIISSTRFDSLDGGAGDDNISAGPEADTINGGDGNDTIDTGDGDDIVIPSSGNDIVDGVPTGGGTNSPIRVNFQPDGAPTPSGYVADIGAVFGTRSNSAQYGWNANNSASTRDRNAVADQRLDTLVHLNLNGSFTWEYALPNGTYDIALSAGDASYNDQLNDLLVEGNTLRDPDGRDNFDSFSTRVTVTDGRLTIRAASTASNAKLNYVEITRVVVPTGSARVNFQPAGVPTPSGYVADIGSVFGTRNNGAQYGWNANNSASTRDRNAVGDQRLDTLVHLNLNGTFTWEYALPNGTYDIVLSAGDAAYTDQVNDLLVEGTLLRDSDGRDNFDSFTTRVTVTDGRLTVRAASTAVNAKLNFIDITPAATSTTRPAAPSNVSLASTPDGVKLTWNDNSNNETYFIIERFGPGSVNNTVFRLPANTTSFVDESAKTINQSYTYIVWAGNEEGPSANTEPKSITYDPAQTVPATPTNLAASNATGGVRLTWTDNATNETGYRVERRLADTTTWSLVTTLGTNANNYLDTSVAGGTRYVYRVYATNVRGYSVESNQASVTTPTVGSSFTSTDIGITGGSTTAVGSNGYDITSRGADVWAARDEFRFVHRQVAGNFDVKVRVANISMADIQSMGGLMARASLAADSANVFVKTRPDGKNRMTYRSTNGGQSVGVGAGTSTFPNAWLRLARVGNTFTGYASTNGTTWTVISSVTIALPTTVYVGMAASAHTNSAATSVQFRDFALS